MSFALPAVKIGTLLFVVEAGRVLVFFMKRARYEAWLGLGKTVDTGIFLAARFYGDIKQANERAAIKNTCSKGASLDVALIRFFEIGYK